jgi:hypothetical protein
MQVLFQKNKHIVWSVIVATAVFLCFSILPAHAAEVQLSPSVGSFASGQTFTATVRVNPQGRSINAVEASLTFDTATLSVVSIAKTGSVFSLWTTEPTFSNTAGTIEFGGGSPTPFSAASTLVVITFRAVSEGTATVDFQNASALAADGLGTDVLSGTVRGTYTITAQAVAPAPQPETPSAPSESTDATIAFGDPPRAPVVGSRTFLDSDVWYKTRQGVFTWDLPFDITAVALMVSTSSKQEPDTSTAYDPPIEEIELTEEDLRDGRQYLHIQFQNQVGWGATLHRQILIDSTPPEPFIVHVRDGSTASSFPLIVFEAIDRTSGIEKYELTVTGGEPVTVTPEEAKLGYLLGNLVDGTYTVTVKAFDRAGNITESSTPVIITAGWTPPQAEDVGSSFWALFTLSNIVIVLEFLTIVALIAYMVMERRRRAERETKLRKETKEIQDQMEKIFSALRDEIYDQINIITKRPRLSKNEREAVESLHNALEVSETLIEKEITDVQKILK